MRSPFQLRSQSQTRDRTDADVRPRTGGESTASDRSDSVADATLFRVGRALFGGVLALNAVDNLRNLEERAGYADAKNAPAPKQSVPAVSGALLAGGLGVVLWRRPAAAAAAIAGFLASTTPVMHDFWNQEDEQERQQELIHFLKNTALFGAALAFMTEGQRRE